ncbi:MAG: hypothetical protein ACRC5H_08325 [Treponemataceae bacterium]
MDVSNDFLDQLSLSIEKKLSWFELYGMPALLKNYKIYFEALEKLYRVLHGKGLVQEDLYKNEKKVFDIALINNTIFPDTDKGVEMGIRLSEYLQMMEYISTYFRFSIASLTIERIHILLELNETFMWASLGNASSNPNTKALADLLGIFRQRGDTITISTINEINAQLLGLSNQLHSQLTDILIFQEELYKEEMRNIIFFHANFSYEEGESVSEIYEKAFTLFKTLQLNKRWESDLIMALVAENFGDERKILQEQVLHRLEVKADEKTGDDDGINSKEMIIDGIATIATIYPQLAVVLEKIETNRKILEQQNINFLTKFLIFLRRMFNVPEKDTQYKLKIFDHLSHNMKTEVVELQKFLSTLKKRAEFYSDISSKSSKRYNAICKLSESALFDFLAQQLRECNRELTFLTALDVFFKSNVINANKTKIRGLKIELSAIQGILLKTNRAKSEYTLYTEQQKQLEKLGFPNV